MKQLAGIWLPDADEHFARFVWKGTYQSSHYYAAKEHVKDFTLALDIGAHVGYWSRLMAEDFKTVFAFEPEAENFDCLVKNIPQNVKTFSFAFSDWTGQGGLYTPKPENTGAWKLNKQGKTVRVLPVDHSAVTWRFDEAGPVGLIKVDVQGSELRVLRGARKVLERHRPVVVVEYTDEGITPFLNDLGAVLLRRKEKDYIFGWKES